jgi:hypothetical protein
VASDRQAATGKDVIKAWRAAEQRALSAIGFGRTATDEYTRALDDAGDWTGTLMLVKRSGGRGVAAARLDPVGFSITHRATEELVGRLTDAGPHAAEHATVPGPRQEVLPPDVKRTLDNLWLDDPERAGEAAGIVADAVEAHILPWMRASAEPRRLLAYLGAPQRNPRFEANRLERLAAFHFVSGDRAAASDALEAYAKKCCDTGVAAVDGPRRLFLTRLRELLDR